MFLFCLVFAMSMWASVYMCFVVTCWKRADLLALRSKAVLLLWIICVIYVLCLSCFCVCSLLPCGHLKGKD